MLVITTIVVQYIEKYKKNIAIDMRKRGMSYSEIENRLAIPKSTLSSWLKKVPVADEDKKKFDDRRLEALRVSSEKRISRMTEKIAAIKSSSAKEIGKVSQRELWLMGIVMYWKERLLLENEGDLKNGIRFTSSDPYLIKLFLKWLMDIGKIESEEITFDIFLQKSKKIKEDAKEYWAEVTGFPKETFSHIYFQKRKPNLGKRKVVNRASFGLLRIRVKASSLLVRQIAGWIRGVIKYYWD